MKRYRLFEVSNCLRLHGQAVELLDREYKGSVILRTSANILQPTRRNMPQLFNLQQALLEDLTSHGSTDEFHIVNCEQKAKDTLLADIFLEICILDEYMLNVTRSCL